MQRKAGNTAYDKMVKSSVKTLAQATGLQYDDVIGNSRKREFVRARNCISYLLKERGKLTLTAIGSHLGSRDHTTILHGINFIKDNVRMYGGYSDYVYCLQQMVEAIKTNDIQFLKVN